MSDEYDFAMTAERKDIAKELERLTRELVEAYGVTKLYEESQRELASAQAELAYARSTGDECALEVDGLRRGLAEARRALQRIADFDTWEYSDRQTVRLLKLEAANALGAKEGER